MLEKKRPNITRYNDYPYIVYVRVSTEFEEQKDSVSNQIDICRYWIEQNNFEWDERSVLKDEGKSGTMFLERSAMQLILQKARAREIKMVVFKSIHRLARDLKDSLEIKEVLLGHNVRVVTLEEGYDSLYEGKNDMKFEMFSMFAAQYPKTQSVSISAALAAKVRRGHHIGRIPYGYKRVNQKLEIKEDEAEVIKQIYKWYNKDGIGFKNITHRLNERLKAGTIPPPRNKKYWQLTTVQRIIKNPTFAGIFILNQYTTVKVDGRKKQIRNPEEKWTVFENHHPAIISKEEWKKANNKPVINKKRKITPWNEFRGGLIKCGECGSNMIIMQSWKKKKDGTKTRWRYLKCSRYRRSKHCVNHTPITYEHFREFIIQELKHEGEKIHLNLKNEYMENRDYTIRQIQKNITDLEEKNKRLLDLYLDEIIDKAEFEEKRASMENEINALNDKLFVLQNEETNIVEIDDIKKAFKSLENNKKDLHHVFKVLLEEVIVHPDGEVDIQLTFKADHY